MKLRKLPHIFLALALLLNAVSAADAEQAVSGQTSLTAMTLAQPPADHGPKEYQFGTEEDKIEVTLSNVYDIQVNPYNMYYTAPWGEEKSNSLAATPMLIKNESEAGMKVSVFGIATPVKDVELEGKSTRREHDVWDKDDPIPEHEERIYVNLQMANLDDTFNPDSGTLWQEFEDHAEWDSAPKTDFNTPVEGSPGSLATENELEIEMPMPASETEPSYASIRLGGDSSLPTYFGAWGYGYGVNVKLFLDFVPQRQAPNGYKVTFEILDEMWWFSGAEKPPLDYTCRIEVQDGPRYIFNKGYASTCAKVADQDNLIHATDNVTVTVNKWEDQKKIVSESDLFFTVYPGGPENGGKYLFEWVGIYRNDGSALVDLYNSSAEFDENLNPDGSITLKIDTLRLDPGEDVLVRIVMAEVPA